MNTYPKVKRGTEANLVNVPIVDGQILITTDTKMMYTDVGNNRICVGGGGN